MSGSLDAPIVAGVDGSDSAVRAVAWAADEARHRRCRLRLVHVVDDLALTYPRMMPIREELQETLRTRGQRLLDTARETAEAAVPGLEVELQLRADSVTPALLAEAESARLLVLGTWGLRPLGRALAGSTSVALAAHARCPVAFVRPHVAEDAPPTEGPVVLGVDDSPACASAIPIAFEEASWRGGELIALHSWDHAFLTTVLDDARWGVDRDAMEEHAREVLAERLDEWAERYPDVSVEYRVPRGRPAEELLRVADRAQLLVVGSRGRGGLAGMLLGSTSQAVMSYALCPVVVARAHTRPD
ncbi:universal stress protein [Amycolatopsis anabasis]|uniref:universal stress protein n=1 Tax=Amycolatopsis anabasis TaxID=1840409 RepID=UPI00131B04B3|nr:universal stress protein [Amycolatopsis anabasis]